MRFHHIGVTRPAVCVTNFISRISMRRRIYVLAIYAASLLGLLGFYQSAECQAWPPIDQYAKHGNPYLADTPTAGGIKLYIDTPAKPKDPRQADKKAFSPLYEKGREEGTIIIFGTSWCGWCKMQMNAIPDGYRVLYVDTENKTGPNWRALMTKWDIVHKVLDKEAPTYPTSVVVVDGVPVHHWYGYKPFSTIQKHVGKAKHENNAAGNRVNNGRDRDGGDCRRRYRPKPKRFRFRRFIFG